MTCLACGKASSGPRCGYCGVAVSPGGYRVERVVAEGPHGRVYRAVGPEGAAVALKELTFAAVPEARQVESFEREAATLRRLDHPAIPRFIAHFTEGDGVHLRLYLASEFIEGASLAARLAGGTLGEGELRALAREGLTVLGHLHARTPPLVHRDVKPANLLRRPDGRWVLVDFGSARQLSSDRTHGSTLVGTFGYMPPEQLGGTVDVTSDLYALGATLLHAATGRPPSDWLGPELQLRVPREVPASLRPWLERLLARRREERFASAEAALAALEGGMPRAPSRPRLVRAVAVGLALALPLCVAGAWLSQASVESSPVVAGKESPARRWFRQAKPSCNPVEVGQYLDSHPPPEGWEGEGYAAGCLALASKVEAARGRLYRVQPRDRYRAAGIVFELAHPVADRGDDVSAGPIMGMVVEFWPNHFQALYHAGMSDYALGQTARAKERLEQFLALYANEDGFRRNAREVLARIKRGEVAGGHPGAH